MGGGLGGGSSNGSFMLKALNKKFKLGLKTSELQKLSEELGSDCPFFIKNKPTHVTGRGEKLKEIEFTLQGKYLVLVLSEIHISTKEAFNGIIPKRNSNNLVEVLNEPIGNWKDNIFNDFEKEVFSAYPVLKTD